jgi:tRNA-intron lyase
MEGSQVDSTEVHVLSAVVDDNDKDSSRSSIVTSREYARKLWNEGAFGSSTRSTRYMPTFVATKKPQTKKRAWGKSKQSTSALQEDDSDENTREESLQLSLLETLYLHKHGAAVGIRGVANSAAEQVHNEFQTRYGSPQSRLTFDERYIAYESFRQAGWIPKVGAQYGSDFVLYESDPNTCHSRYSVVMEDARKSCSLRSVLGHMRVAEQTRKKLVICSGEAQCIQIKRWVLKHEQANVTGEPIKKIQKKSTIKHSADKSILDDSLKIL